MKWNRATIITAVAAAIFFSLAVGTASAQFTIKIPKIPKVKTQPTTSPTPSDGGQTSSSGNDEKSSVPAGKPCTGDAVLDYHMERIETTRKQAEDYTPGARDYYVRDFDDNENLYLKAALSPTRRQEWLSRMKGIENCLTPALDTLAAVARKTLPSYAPTGYDVHNVVEEKVLRSGVTDLAKATVFKVGLQSPSWKIAKDNYNFPTSRFKYGMIWARYPNLDDGFCRIIYVNLVQDYAGGGTYGDSYGSFIKSEYAGCPAGK